MVFIHASFIYLSGMSEGQSSRFILVLFNVFLRKSDLQIYGDIFNAGSLFIIRRSDVSSFDETLLMIMSRFASLPSPLLNLERQ